MDETLSNRDIGVLRKFAGHVYGGESGIPFESWT